MSLVNQLNVPTVDWTIKGVKVYSDGSNNLTLDASGNSSYNVVFSKYGVKKAVVGNNIDVCSNSVLNSCAMTIGQFDNSSNTNLNAYGAYYSFGENATQLALGTTAQQPSIGRPGYIRFNTTESYFEYWSTISNSWVPVSSPTPTFSSISPDYVPEDSSFNYTVTGTNFQSGASIAFISVSGNIEYAPAFGTTFVSSTQLQGRNTLTMSDEGAGLTGAGTLGYKIKITNPSGNSVTTPAAVLTYNEGPVFTTAANANLGTGISGEIYTYATSPFTDLSASDSGGHIPIKYYYSSGGAPLGATLVTLDPSGRLIGTMPFNGSLPSDSTTFTFTAYPQDNLGAIGPIRSFQFTIIAPLILTLTNTSNVSTNYYIAQSFFDNNLDFSLNLPYSVGSTNSVYTLSISRDASFNIFLKGGDGGGGNEGASQGGSGGSSIAQLRLLRTNSYKILVGGGGLFMNAATSQGPSVIGGGGLAGTSGYGGQGGGYSGLFTTSVSQGNSLVIAAGGGGGAWEAFTNSTTSGSTTSGRNGGGGGGTDGLNGQPGADTFGGGGTQSAGGTSSGGGGGYTGAGTALKGGDCGTSGDAGGGGAGGGGYWGGGAGTGNNPGSSGGGGSGYMSPSLTITKNMSGGVPTTGAGANGANGNCIIYFNKISTPISLTYSSGQTLPSPTTVNNCLVYSFTVTGVTYTFTINKTCYGTYLAVGGGGSGGGNGGGGGGGGGFATGSIVLLAGSTISVTVGAGGARISGVTVGNQGGNSTISGNVSSAITAIGGGGGGTNNPSSSSGTAGTTGGSGGGGGTGNGSSVTTVAGSNSSNSSQGYAGGSGCHVSSGYLGGGGGGGAGGWGGNMGNNPAGGNNSGNGGSGQFSYITGSKVYYAGGGGGGLNSNTTSGSAGSGGQGGGGPGNKGGATASTYDGTNGLGGGGGGAEHPTYQTIAGQGGSGIVILSIPNVW